MRDYISREAALIEIGDADDTMCAGRRVWAIPASDVVEVVRCGQCKHYNAGFECLIEGYGIERPADYFCADGERKDGGNTDADI